MVWPCLVEAGFITEFATSTQPVFAPTLMGSEAAGQRRGIVSRFIPLIFYADSSLCFAAPITSPNKLI